MVYSLAAYIAIIFEQGPLHKIVMTQENGCVYCPLRPADKDSSKGSEQVVVAGAVAAVANVQQLPCNSRALALTLQVPFLRH